MRKFLDSSGNDNKEKGFNFNDLFVERLNERLNDIDKALIEADLHNWFNILYGIFRSIHYKFVINKSMEAEENLENRFKKILNIFLSKNDELIKKNGSVILDDLIALDKEINFWMYDFGLIERKKEHIDIDKEMESDNW